MNYVEKYFSGATVLYLLYFLIGRFIVPRSHRKGIRLVKENKFKDEIIKFEASYKFFSKYQIVDKFRHLILGTSGSISFREMALCNIAYCFYTIGDLNNSQISYQKALEEFPKSDFAIFGLEIINNAIHEKSKQLKKGVKSAVY